MAGIESLGIVAAALMAGLCYWLWRRLRAMRQLSDSLSMAALDHYATRNRVASIGQELLECHLEKDKMAEALAQRTLEIEDTIKSLETMSMHLTMKERVDAEEKKRIALLEKLVFNLTQVQVDGNGRRDAGRIVSLMSKHFTQDRLSRFAYLQMGESLENITMKGTLIDQCADLYRWAEDEYKLGTLMRNLIEEFPNVEWRG